MKSEQARFEFLVSRDGMEGALDFAERTMRIYRKGVLHSRKCGHSKPHHASLPEYRQKFIRSYLYLKRKYLKRDILLNYTK